MSSQAQGIFDLIKESNRYDRMKIIFLAATFFLVVAAYTIVYDLKNSIFMSIVGKEYIPWAKMLSMIALILPVFFYSYLVDNLRRYQLLMFYSIAYAVFGFGSVYFIGHPSIGLVNTDSSPFRVFGWIFYFFVEGFSPFMVSVFWAFANSISNPKEAKNNYGLLVSASKMGGMFSAALAWRLLSYKNGIGCMLFSDVINHQILLTFFSFLLILIPFIIHLLIKKVPGRYMHGYEAVYKFEKQKKEGKSKERLGLLSGLNMIIKRPYILGIFGMLFFYEVLNTILGYQRLGVAKSAASTISGVSCFLYQQMFYMHFVGFFLSLIGTRTLLNMFGERVCLMLIPLSSGLLLFYFLFTYTPQSLLVVFIILRSIHYAFAQPVRESLYIPTVKDIKFKSKSWIDAFGSKLARGSGSTFNVIAELAGQNLFLTIHSVFFTAVIMGWGITAWFLGKRYARAIEHSEVIGS